jgi:hypothetical protein
MIVFRINSTLFLYLVGYILSSGANAGEVSFLPAVQYVRAGEQVSLELRGNFQDESTLGGGTDISYDPSLLTLVSFTHMEPGDAQYLREPDLTPGQMSGVAFGSFNGFVGSSLHIGTFVFDVSPTAPPGPVYVSIASSVSVAGGFASNVSYGPQTVQFTAGTISVLGDSVHSDGFEGP